MNTNTNTNPNPWLPLKVQRVARDTLYRSQIKGIRAVHEWMGRVPLPEWLNLSYEETEPVPGPAGGASVRRCWRWHEGDHVAYWIVSDGYCFRWPMGDDPRDMTPAELGARLLGWNPRIAPAAGGAA